MIFHWSHLGPSKGNQRLAIKVKPNESQASQPAALHRSNISRFLDLLATYFAVRPLVTHPKAFNANIVPDSERTLNRSVEMESHVRRRHLVCPGQRFRPRPESSVIYGPLG